jgi:hypothetical protein
LLDYGAGNVRSVRNAIKKLGYTIKDVSGICSSCSHLGFFWGQLAWQVNPAAAARCCLIYSNARFNEQYTHCTCRLRSPQTSHQLTS